MNPLILALAACIGHGFCGALISVYMSEISARKVQPFVFYALSNLLGGVLAWCIVPFCHAEIPERLPLLSLILGACGFTYVVALYVQIQCFTIGKKGLTSACTTSAIIIPFLFGVIAMGERPRPLGYLGALCLLCGMVVCVLTGKQKEEETQAQTQGNYMKWFALTMLCIVLNGCGAILQSLSSWMGFDNVSGMFRAALLMVLSGVGNLLACAVVRANPLKGIKSILPWAAIWAVVGTATNLIFFVAMDAMAKVGAGSFTTCISSTAALLFFFLYTSVRFRERYRPVTILGIIICLLGIFAIGL